MENIPGNMGSALAGGKIKRVYGRMARSTFLIVDDRGGRTAVRNFMAMAGVMAAFLFVSAASAGIFFALYKGARDENAALSKDLAASRARAASLQDDKEMLLAKLAMLERASRGDLGPGRGKGPVKTRLTDFSLSGNPGGLRAAFRLGLEGVFEKPDSPWRLLAVLKGDAGDEKTWRFFPAGAFDSGEPSSPARGVAYSPGSNGPVTLDIKGAGDPSAFHLFRVYLFDSKGKLMSEREFSIK
ncbi:hypothetical protein EPICR_50271 [Candidatus Desulfarcum epimagneticum]|uniref:Uncharacterized protein n=1 Tax=uncultured Desulfobacteraceae bacterium TaxID=218296 RepID=A0A484HLA9_9BACT|nr:hypothetical protein EPICR_50271 [uncultured Desulfobacteraceae bacterium]